MQNRNLKKIAITGASGFLGRNLVPLLLDIADEVIAITSKNRDELIRICDIKSNFAGLKVVNCANYEEIKQEIQDADRLVNCAFPRGKDGEAYAQGLRFIAEIFKIANEFGVEAVINISSQSVYSQYRTEPATEETPVCLETKYAVAKYATELLAEAYCQNCYYTNIRLASLIGPEFDQRVVNKMIQRVMAGEELEIQENYSQYGYLDIRDAVKAIAALCYTPFTPESNSIYNIGPSKAYSLTEIAECVLGCIKQHKHNKDNYPTARIIKKDQLSTNSSISSVRFIELTGWSQEFDLKDTVNLIIKTCQNYL